MNSSRQRSYATKTAAFCNFFFNAELQLKNNREKCGLALAQSNLQRLNLKGELLCTDVRELQFPNEPLVVFLYNPFWEDVMREVANRLEESLRQHPREVYVVYYSAPFRDAWEKPAFSVLRSCAADYPNYVLYASSLSHRSLQTPSPA